MVYKNLIYEKKEGVAKVTLNRPSVMNALTPALLSEIKSAILEAAKDNEVKVIVLTGAGRAFSTGIDLTVLGERKLKRGRVGPLFDKPAKELIHTIQTVPKVVIAMVNGYCLTGALEIALVCDLIIASEEAKLGDTHARWGVRPSWGISQHLPFTVGILKAKELSFTADMITGREAERIGLVNMAVPAEKLEETVQELAKKIAANSLEAIAASKYLYNKGMEVMLKKGLEIEAKSEFDIKDTNQRLAKLRKKD